MRDGDFGYGVREFNPGACTFEAGDQTSCGKGGCAKGDRTLAKTLLKRD